MQSEIVVLLGVAAGVVAAAVAIMMWRRKRRRDNMSWFALMAEKVERDAKRRYEDPALDFPLPPGYAKARKNPFLIAPWAIVPALFIAGPPLPYYWIIALAVLSGLWFCWITRADIAQSRRNAEMEVGGYFAFTTLLLVISVGVCFLAVQSAVYFAMIGLLRLIREGVYS